MNFFFRKYVSVKHIVISSLALLGVVSVSAILLDLVSVGIFWVYHSSAGTRYIKIIGESGTSRLYPGWSQSDLKMLWDETYVPLIYESYTGFKERPRSGRFVNVAQGGYRENVGKALWPEESTAINVFVFGGSTTFGYGVADWETIPSGIQSELGTVYCGKPLRVYNFGRGYYYSTQERVLFERLLTNGRRPTAAVFIDGYNDSDKAEDLPQYDDDFTRLFQMQQGELSIVSALVSSTNIGRLTRRVSDRFGGDSSSEMEQVAKGKKAAIRWTKSIGLTAAAAREAGVLPLFVVQPVRAYQYDLQWHPMKDRMNNDPWLASVRAFYDAISTLRNTDARFRDVLWLAETQLDRDQRTVYVDSGHYSAEFSAYLGKLIAQDLRRRLSPCSSPQ